MLIVTATDGTRRAGCLAGFSTQCSIDPPRYLVCLSKNNHTYSVARHADALAVHLPGPAEMELATLFGTQTGFEVDKFSRCAWHEGPAGVPLLDGCPRWFTGRILQRHDVGDHVAFLLHLTSVSSEPGSGQLGFQDVRHLDAGNEA
ncbi:MAG TPA: flavin reductase family protein [Cryptosporangiaceae bacterium]|nr:flavin reductase family protein [Cryptosporangiaceae bacterium]